jgi:hypothetical protein
MSHVVTCKLYDLATTQLADISSIALEKTLTRRLNAARGFTIQAPAGHSLLTSVAGDGYRNLRKGNRKLLVWEDGNIIFHGRVFGVERTGDGTKNTVAITAWDPWMELGFDPDRAGRPVRDSTGNFINPSFSSSVGGQTGISGPDLIKQVLTNSQVSGAESPGPGGEGPLPIDLTTGSFDLLVPPAVDLNPVLKMDWPVMIGDFINELVASHVVDVNLRPIDPSEGLNNYKMAALSAVSSFGTDRSATVHFDYFTGSKNAIACRHVEDFLTINNKLYDYLGPRIDQNRWLSNITPGSPGTTIDPSASRALYGGPGANKGQFMSIRVFDSTGSGSGSRPLYIALWNAEQRLRVEPRDLLYVTPAPDAEAIYEPPHDFDVGDLITINTGADFGITLAQTQRVYGYDRSWNREGVATVSQLLTSADPA